MHSADSQAEVRICELCKSTCSETKCQSGKAEAGGGSLSVCVPGDLPCVVGGVIWEVHPG